MAITPPKNEPAKNEETDWENNPERTVCFCYNVTLGTLKKAIAAGATDLKAIKDQTCASTGCMGCEPEVQALLDAQVTQT